jgi:GNAT superfamily N-acetyltransferase
MKITPLIRPACKNDVGVLASFAQEFEEYLNSLNDGRNEKPAMTQDVFLRDGFGSNPAFNGLLAEIDGEAVGYLLYHQGYITDVAARTLQVIDLFVKKTARQAGIGTRLMKALIPICNHVGASLICTSVWKLNPSAQDFYRKLGADLVEEETIVWWAQARWPQD